MTPEFPPNPRAEKEARLTAYLLGELPAHEAATVRLALDEDAELAQLCERLKPVIKLVRANAAELATPTTVPSAPPKLSDDRRQKLLAHFKTVTPTTAPSAGFKLSDDRRQKLLANFKTITPKEFAPPPRRQPATLLGIAAVAVITLLIAGSLLPSLSRTKSRSVGLDQKFSLAEAPAGPPAPRPGGRGMRSSTDGELTHADRSGFGTFTDESVRRQMDPRKLGSAPADQSNVGNRWNTLTMRASTIQEQLQAPATPPPPVVAPPDASRTTTIVLPSSNEPADSTEPAVNGWKSGAKTTTPDIGYDFGGVSKPSGSRASGSEDKPTNGFVARTAGDPEWVGELGRPNADVGATNHVAGSGLYEQNVVGYVHIPTDSITNSLALNSTPSFKFDALEAEPGIISGNGNNSPEVRGKGGTPSNVTHYNPLQTRSSTVAQQGGGKVYFANSSSFPIATQGGSGGSTADSIYPNSTQLGTASLSVDPETRSVVVVSGDQTFEGINKTIKGLDETARRKGKTETVAISGDITSGLRPGQGITNHVLGDFADGSLAWNPGTGNAGIPFAESNSTGGFNWYLGNTSIPKLVGSNGYSASGQLADADQPRFYLDLNRNPESGPTESRKGITNNIEREYAQAKADLEVLKKSRDDLHSSVAQGGVEEIMAKTDTTQVLDYADAERASSPSLGERVNGIFGGKTERKARVKMQRDVTDIPAGMASQPYSKGAYDPHSIQTESEIIQSEAVLDKAIEKLDLNKAWADKNGGGEKLNTAKTRELLRKSLDVRAEKNTSVMDIGVKSEKPEEAARIANAVAEAYLDYRKDQRKELALAGIDELKKNEIAQNLVIQKKEAEVAALGKMLKVDTAWDVSGAKGKVAENDDVPVKKPAAPAPIPQPEILTRENSFSTFSLNVSDVSFKLAAASLEKGVLPEPASIRSEEFINAFNYRDPDPAPGAPIGFAWERAQDPFAQNRDLVRFSVKTAAAGREPGRPLNIVLLLDNSGSMERADRVQIIHEALRVLATQLQPQDKLSVVTFARTARLWVDGVPGSEAGTVAEQVGNLTPQGGTNLEEAMRIAYETARRHYLPDGVNRVVLLTDGAANLGNVEPAVLKQKVEENRKQGIALDCFGIGWEGYNDDLLEVLARNGDGRYGFLNTPEEAATDFAGQLAGALRVAASDVKVQVEFNPKRVTTYRQIGYAKHQLTKEQFRDNTVNAAQIGAAESGNALYTIAVNPAGEGPLGTVRVRFRVPGTSDYQEHAWELPYTGNCVSLDQASPAMRLAATASAFSESLASSPFAAEVTSDQLLGYLRGVPEVYGADARPKKLEWMIRQVKSLSGK